MTDLDQLTQCLARNLKRWRSERHFTLDALAARSGVSRGMIIQIEQARTNPSVGTTVKLADALGVSITALLEYEEGSKVRIVPAEQAVRLWSSDTGSHTTLVVGTEARGPLELVEWRITPGEGNSSDPHLPGTAEMVHVRAGELTMIVDGVEHRVPAGSSATFESDVPHGYRNDGDTDVEMTMVVSVPPAR
ncbi:transcriptional regulator [Streptomyces mashuensis]|uniref:Transcriptional regulator n=1 Tax=Streptomyces mashuensis TaxID=33904 RepID=A0A919AXR7_9ACTN|nr:XRE family transcriptional regulator [Streptomyces mashuensis]GHF30166.1 transcriptional regulator [Streptomyces mashuensis]